MSSTSRYQNVWHSSVRGFTAATATSTKGLQAIATETTDYAKKSFEKSRAHFEKLRA